MIPKYQFSISFNEKQGTAASKAVQDCTAILNRAGYIDFNCITSLENGKWYILDILSSLLRLLMAIKPGSLVAIQYPLLSGNKIFKYFIKAAHLRRAKVFCIIHDIDELRYYSSRHGNEETRNLNHYDYIITHNTVMSNWLQTREVRVPMAELRMFDYLCDLTTDFLPVDGAAIRSTIVFAGNLSKSNFIYSLARVNGWSFNVYGPNFQSRGKHIGNICWKGAYGSTEIIGKLEGDFGLIWDGELIEELDGQYGNYLKYNNPHKLSLYLAAGLPVIAPGSSAVSAFIIKHNIGILVDNLTDLSQIRVTEAQYTAFKRNVETLQYAIKRGEYFSTAIRNVENFLAA